MAELVFGWSQVSDGNMSLKYGDPVTVKNNRERFFEKLGINSEDLVTLSLLGGTNVTTVTSQDKGRMLEADAAIAEEAGVGLFMVVGDCFPVIMFDPIKNILALAHCGRSGIEGNIVNRVIERLSCQGIDTKDLMVKIGPGIKKESYRFPKEDLDKRISSGDNMWKPYLQVDENDWTMIDLVGFLKKQLDEGGVIKENIWDSGIDTCADKNYFSHYRDRGKIPSFAKATEGKEGRFGVVAIIKE